MRRLLLLLLLMIGMLCKAQERAIDSLRNLLSQTETDTGRLRIYSALGNRYSYIHTDSSVYFAGLALETAKKLNIPLILANEYASAGYAHYIAGDYVNSLRYFLKGMSIAEAIEPGSKKIDRRFIPILNSRDSVVSVDTLRYRIIGRIHFNLSNIYLRTGQVQRTIEELLIGKGIFEAYRDSAFLYYTSMNLSNAYSLNGQYADGIGIGNVALELSKQLKVTSSKPWNHAYIGYNYLKLGKVNEAKRHFYEAVETAKVVDNLRAPVLPYQYLAEAFLISKQTDSALYYAHMALHITQQQKFKYMIMPIDTLLAAIHVSGNRMDSAYFYLKAANDLREELLNGQKNQELQAIVEDEQKRKADLLAAEKNYSTNLKLLAFGAGLLVLVIMLLLVYRSSRIKQKGFTLLQKQKHETDRQKEATEKALHNLKETQQQLVQAEKMASLGELTAGIAHEIQNPLNFINNFSDLTKELTSELKEELDNNHVDTAKSIADDITANAEKIVHHGKRADAIIKNMLLHSRSGSLKKEPTDINALADEYLRLSYHGLRAKDKSFNASFKTDFDENVGKVNVMPQDVGRVLLNFFNNAFYALNEKRKHFNDTYQPMLEVSTKRNGDKVIIKVKDNGMGIPQKVLNKIYQPFFTTKPTGEGTGLGLSLSYDIITKGHGGEITVSTTEGEGAEFIIIIPHKA